MLLLSSGLALILSIAVVGNGSTVLEQAMRIECLEAGTAADKCPAVTRDVVVGNQKPVIQ